MRVVHENPFKQSYYMNYIFMLICEVTDSFSVPLPQHSFFCRTKTTHARTTHFLTPTHHSSFLTSSSFLIIGLLHVGHEDGQRLDRLGVRPEKTALFVGTKVHQGHLQDMRYP